MELEHVMQHSNFFLALQMVFMGSLLVPGMVGRMDLYSKVVRQSASHVVTFGPIGLLAYVLYQVSLLQ